MAPRFHTVRRETTTRPFQYLMRSLRLHPFTASQLKNARPLAWPLACVVMPRDGKRPIIPSRGIIVLLASPASFHCFAAQECATTGVAARLCCDATRREATHYPVAWHHCPARFACILSLLRSSRMRDHWRGRFATPVLNGLALSQGSFSRQAIQHWHPCKQGMHDSVCRRSRVLLASLA